MEGCVEPGVGMIVLNEILADPRGLDVNGDQVPDTHEDEFVELLNRTDKDLDLSGVTLRVGSRTVHVFEPRCLKARAALVIFGGGHPVALPSEAIVAQSRLTLANDGSTVLLMSAQGGLGVEPSPLLDSISYGADARGPHSHARMPDGTGTWGAHTTVEGTAVSHSAGRCNVGGEFPECAPPAPAAGDREHPDSDEGARVDPPCPAPQAGELVLNELLVDPGKIDANGDGEFAWQRDEFVEVVLDSDTPRNLEGVTLQVNGTTRATLPPGCIDPLTTLVIFARGAELPADPAVRVVEAGQQLMLKNSGATVRLIAANGLILDKTSYGPEAANDQSLTRHPDITGFWQLHGETPAGTPASPGTCTTGAPLAQGCLQDAHEVD